MPCEHSQSPGGEKGPGPVGTHSAGLLPSPFCPHPVLQGEDLFLVGLAPPSPGLGLCPTRPALQGALLPLLCFRVPPILRLPSAPLDLEVHSCSSELNLSTEYLVLLLCFLIVSDVLSELPLGLEAPLGQKL